MIVKRYKKRPAWETEVKTRFALIPTKDRHLNWFWLEKYFITGDDVRWYSIGRAVEYPTKEIFYRAVYKEN